MSPAPVLPPGKRSLFAKTVFAAQANSLFMCTRGPCFLHSLRWGEFPHFCRSKMALSPQPQPLRSSVRQCHSSGHHELDRRRKKSLPHPSFHETQVTRWASLGRCLLSAPLSHPGTWLCLTFSVPFPPPASTGAQMPPHHPSLQTGCRSVELRRRVQLFILKGVGTF